MNRAINRCLRLSRSTRLFTKKMSTPNYNHYKLHPVITRLFSTQNRSSSSGLGFSTPNSHPKFPAEKFESLCIAQLKKLDAAFREMKAYESRIEVINFQPVVLDLEVEIAGMGYYRFYANIKDSLLLLFSPLGGSFMYYYDTTEKAFYNTRDGHNMEEYLIRELLGKVNGYLNL